jgi:hypothetical protein
VTAGTNAPAPIVRQGCRRHNGIAFAAVQKFDAVFTAERSPLDCRLPSAWRCGAPLLEHFPENTCPALDAGWTPVFRRKCDRFPIHLKRKAV